MDKSVSGDWSYKKFSECAMLLPFVCELIKVVFTHFVKWSVIAHFVRYRVEKASICPADIGRLLLSEVVPYLSPFRQFTWRSWQTKWKFSCDNPEICIWFYFLLLRLFIGEMHSLNRSLWNKKCFVWHMKISSALPVECAPLGLYYGCWYGERRIHPW